MPAAPYTLSAPFATDENASAPAPAARSRPTNAGLPPPAASPPPRRPNFQYDLSDIEKAHSISYVSRLHTVPRSPLDPVYQLASVVERPVTPPRFLRDPLDVSDIDRARSRDPFVARATRVSSSLECGDIAGTSPLRRYTGTARELASLRDKDITRTRFVSTRHTDPLQPVYEFGRETSLDVSSILSRVDPRRSLAAEEKESGGNLATFGPVAGSQSRTGPRGRAPRDIFNLRTDDISSAEAAEWSWTKPQRTLVRNTTDTSDIPGAQVFADRARMHRTSRHTDPNTREYETGGLGGRSVPDNAGMVHVHRHVLDNTPAAETWRPAQGEPHEDAAGISLWRTGNFTAGTQYPRKKVPVVQTSAAASQSRKVIFGAPAEDAPLPDVPPARESVAPASIRVATPPAPAPLDVSSPQFESPVFHESSPLASSGASSGAAVDASSLSGSPLSPNADPAFTSYPIDTRKVARQQKRHVASSVASSANVFGAHGPLNLLASPASDGREHAVTQPEARLPVMLFGTRGPFNVPAGRATIEETQTASAPSSLAVSRSNSRSNSRPLSRAAGGATNGASAASLLDHVAPESRTPLGAYASTAATLRNAFGFAFVPSSTQKLPVGLPHSSPIARPGLGTVELFERRPVQGGAAHPPAASSTATLRAQERAAATLRASEIQAVRALV